MGPAAEIFPYPVLPSSPEKRKFNRGGTEWAPSSSCAHLRATSAQADPAVSVGVGLQVLAHTPSREKKQDPLNYFHVDTLLTTTHNLLFGGTETVGTTLCYALLALMKYPKVQGASQPCP